jgi:hypothetical protein
MTRQFENTPNEGVSIQSAANLELHTKDTGVLNARDGELTTEFLQLGKDPKALQTVLEQMRTAKVADPSSPSFYVVHDATTQEPYGIVFSAAVFSWRDISFAFSESEKAEKATRFVAEGGFPINDTDPIAAHWPGLEIHRNEP